MIKNKEIIYLSLNDGEYHFEINLSNERKIYTNKTYDTTIIEILPKVDKIHIENNILIDENINQKSINYKGNSIYILQYPEGNEASVSYGIITDIENKENEYQFKNLCSTNRDSSVAPILNLKTNKKQIK